MSKEQFVVTPKGTKLPLLNLKGKPYLMGAYRLVWLNEEYSKFTINTDFLAISEDQTVARSVVTLFDKDGKPIKSATATKRETKKDFPDHTEKAESSSIFRALAMLGMGTQHAIAEFDEGMRLADSPVEPAAKKEATSVVTNGSMASGSTTVEVLKTEAPKSSFRKKPEAPKEEKVEASGDWE